MIAALVMIGLVALTAWVARAEGFRQGVRHGNSQGRKALGERSVL